MPDVSLRAYHRKIENWIEEDNIDKSISQIACLLREFPKELQSWRCLSKAMLQKQDFVNADKVFEIILRVDPDDFVSHIGKSMAAEYRGEMEIAVEHMRHAFEIQPSNEGLQSELKRLIVKHDGFEPNKVRLTRGALIKMYLRGSLYEQAIAEALIGIRENSQRADYHLALAESYQKVGDYAKSVEICVNILNELPYCQKANEILDSILSQTSTDNTLQTYRQRLIALDPYYAYITETTASVLDVPDIAVMIEDQSGQLPGFVNIEILIAESWDHENENSKEFVALEWHNIIEKALNGSPPEVNFNVVEYKEVSESEMNKSEIEESPQPSSRKETFLEKLRSTSRKHEESRIPEWIFDQDDELIQIPQTDETHIALEQINESESNKFDHATDEDLASSVLLEPANTEEHESEWVSETIHENIDPKVSTPKPLEDTQEIQVMDNQPAFLLEAAEKAIVGENYQFAVATLRKLANQGNHLNEIVSRVELIVQDHPESSDMLIFLGELYTCQGKRAEALAVYKKAQKNIFL
ncbi:MAG: hypothetical protein FJZ98_03410 [Chloroflexi bacterium]|nr:hypothetical protein [Chloroflexota bacterium]